jgi:hypothetical protein
MEGLHWPWFGVVVYFSLVDVLLEMPAFFEISFVVRTDLGGRSETVMLSFEESVSTLDAHRTKRVVVVRFENGTHQNRECR